MHTRYCPRPTVLFSILCLGASILLAFGQGVAAEAGKGSEKRFHSHPRGFERMGWNFLRAPATWQG